MHSSLYTHETQESTTLMGRRDPSNTSSLFFDLTVIPCRLASCSNSTIVIEHSTGNFFTLPGQVGHTRVTKSNEKDKLMKIKNTFMKYGPTTPKTILIFSVTHPDLFLFLVYQ